MKLIFLDIDGVLNNDHTKERVAGYTFVDEDKIVLLKEILYQTGAKIVLSSTWRRGWYCYDNSLYEKESDRQDIQLFEALKNKLLEFEIELMSYTEDFGRRGVEIDKWLSDWKGEPIERFVILDDMSGAELQPHSHFLVQTGFRDGLMPKHVQKAIQILKEQ